MGMESGAVSYPGSANITSIVSSTTSQVFSTDFPYRRGLVIFNESPVPLKIAFAAICTAAAYTIKIAPQGCYEMPNPIYTGVISGVWESPSGFAVMTQLY